MRTRRRPKRLVGFGCVDPVESDAYRFTVTPDRDRVAIGLNGAIVATPVSYLEQGEWVFASMVPEEALVSGANELQVFVLDGVNDDAVLGSARMQENGA